MNSRTIMLQKRVSYAIKIIDCFLVFFMVLGGSCVNLIK